MSVLRAVDLVALLAPPPSAVSRTFVAGASVAPVNNNFSAGTVTFTGLNGAVNYPANALVIVGVYQDEDATPLTGVLIGGAAATLVSGSQDSSTRSSLYQAVMAGSSADTFSCTNGNTLRRIAVAGCYLTGESSTVSAASNLTSNSGTDPEQAAAAITVPLNGFGIAFLGAANATLTGANTVTWAGCVNAAGDVNAGPTVTTQISLAHTATAGSWRPTISGNTVPFSFISAMSVAAWGP